MKTDVRTTILRFSLLVALIIGCKGQTQKQPIKDYQGIDKSKYSNNPGICIDTCFGDFKELGVKRIGGTLNIYISGHNVDIMRDCCQWTFGEIVYNKGSNDSTIEIVKTHLIDLEIFNIPKDSSEYGNNDVRKKVICIGIYNLKKGTIKIIADPYNYGIYKKPKDWG